MAGNFAWKNPRFEDYDYTSWLPEDDTMAWLGNGNVVAEYTDVGDSTTYMDFTDVSQVLAVPTKDFQDAGTLKPIGAAEGITTKQHEALENISTTPVPNTALDQNAPASTKIAASAENGPLGSPAVPGKLAPLVDSDFKTNT